MTAIGHPLQKTSDVNPTKNRPLRWSTPIALLGILLLFGCDGGSEKAPEGQDSTSAMMKGVAGAMASGGPQTLGTGGAPGESGPR